MSVETVERVTGEPCGTWRRLEHRDAWVCAHDFLITGEDVDDLERRGR